jgi:hypothetical protein
VFLGPTSRDVVVRPLFVAVLDDRVVIACACTATTTDGTAYPSADCGSGSVGYDIDGLKTGLVLLDCGRTTSVVGGVYRGGVGDLVEGGGGWGVGYCKGQSAGDDGEESDELHLCGG